MLCPAVKRRLKEKMDNHRPSTQELLECFVQLSKGGWKKRGGTLLAIARPALLCTEDSNRTDGMTHPTGFSLKFSDTNMFGFGVVEEDAADDLERAATLIRRSVNMSYTTKESKNT